VISLGMVDYPQREYHPGLGEVQWGMGRVIGSKGRYRPSAGKVHRSPGEGLHKMSTATSYCLDPKHRLM